MQKQYFYTLAILLLGCLNMNAQEVKPKNNAIKIYSNFHILNSGEASRFRLPDSSGFHFHNISIAFSKNRKDSTRFFEAEFSFRNQNKDGGWLLRESTIDTTSIPRTVVTSEKVVQVSTEDFVFAFRFGFGRWWKTFQDEKLKLGWSTSLRAYIHTSKLIPKTSETFPISDRQGYLKLAFAPRVKYYLSRDLFLDLNFPIDLLSVGLDFTTIENPAFTERQQRQGGPAFDVPLEVLLRFGLGYQF